ncbi:sodium/glutamate symporter [Paracoccus cavernae]|uniref:sodium/glutamate symporter n=1 Tax=Paracoccus cavernae TaxID=1571207 RepID=UPI0035F408ED
MHPLVLDGYNTLIIAAIVLLVGRYLVRNVKFLNDFNIPEPVVGGLVAAILLTIAHAAFGFVISIHGDLQTAMMLMFFSSIGLGADFGKLKAGGKPLVVLTIVVGVFILVQNITGITMATLFGMPPLTGLVTGSITLTGGHGTAAGWGPRLEELGVTGATTLGIACATFGLVIGGLLGGPVARRLIAKHNLTNTRHTSAGATPDKQQLDATGDEPPVNEDGYIDTAYYQFENPTRLRLITAQGALETLSLFAVCLAASSYISVFISTNFPKAPVTIPTFVWALATGVVVRNLVTPLFSFNVFDRCVDVIGNVALSLFLAMALLSLKLWELVDLAIPLLAILAVQTAVLAVFASVVTFRAMGKDYDAAVVAVGHCGFGMGATPTAVANMQAITSKYGASHKAFLIIPLVGAFFVDIINAAVLSIFTSLPFLN